MPCSLRKPVLFAGGLLALALLAAGPARAQNSDLVPRTDDFLVNSATSFNQFWVRVDCDSAGQTWAFSFSSGLDPLARLFDLDAQPLTGTLSCTPNLNQGTQDEAEVCVDSATGNVLVAWSDRHSYDGEQMGIFGRLFSPTGPPLTAEFQINETWQASQWRPLIVSPPTGGFVVTWSGDWDADGYFRILDSSGGFLSGDIPVNTYTNGGQADPALAIAPDGRMFFAYIDYAGLGPPNSGLNLFGRMFDAAGVPLQSQEYILTTLAFSSGDQREPRVAADGLGRFVVTWDSPGQDGSSWGVIARRFDNDGAPLGSEFIVPSTTASMQRNSRVEADEQGGFVVVWEDWSGPDADIRARAFDSQAVALGPDFVVHQNSAGDQVRPSLAATTTGVDVVFCWEGPGVQTDVFARFFDVQQLPEIYCTAKLNSQGCTPALSYGGTPALSGADDFVISASQVLNNKFGIFFHGPERAALPFGGGTLCVEPPLVRTNVQSSGGNPPPDDCSGAYSFHFSQAYMQQKGLGAGDVVHVQAWSRDPAFSPPDNIGLTDAIAFQIQP